MLIAFIITASVDTRNGSRGNVRMRLRVADGVPPVGSPAANENARVSYVRNIVTGSRGIQRDGFTISTTVQKGVST